MSSNGNWASLPTGLPPAGTPSECLSVTVDPNNNQEMLPLSRCVGGNKYVFCTLDYNDNPTSDCMRFIAYFCDPNKLAKGSTFIAECKSNVNYLIENMNPHWRNYRKFCGKWAYTGPYTLPLSTTCSSATTLLQQNALYNEERIGTPFIDSVKSQLWDSPYLQR